MHIVSDKSLQRPGYICNESGIGYPEGMRHSMNWKHIDGPLMYHSNGQLHWLTWRERLALWFGFATEEAIDANYVSGRKRHW
jgi:hypothetical protein